MYKTELVSVIITTYKRKNEVLNAIHSVLNQSYSELEIIVVDDGSSDDTVCISLFLFCYLGS